MLLVPRKSTGPLSIQRYEDESDMKVHFGVLRLIMLHASLCIMALALIAPVLEGDYE